MSNATRIADLPVASGENIVMSTGGMGGMGGGGPMDNGNTYMPMNVHPNPYGGADGPGMGPPPPVHDFRERGERERNGGGGGGGTTALADLGIPNYVPPQQQRLPSRDIPMDTTQYAQDENIQANRLPKPPKSVRIADYVEEYSESDSLRRIEKHEREKRERRVMENMWTDIQIPILVALLYMVFQLGALNRFLYRYTHLLGIPQTCFASDGTLNMYGIILQGVLFGGVYAALMKTVQTVLSW
jgi:hypothetical protein